VAADLIESGIDIEYLTFGPTNVRQRFLEDELTLGKRGRS